MELNEASVSTLNSELATAHPREVLTKVLQEVPNTALSFSGAEDVLLIHFASKLPVIPKIFTLDTGRLHPETYEFIETVRNHFGLDIHILSPDSQQLESLVREKGLFSFYRDGHEECCSIRKVEPLRRALQGLEGWITGQRRDQSPTRVEVPVLELDAEAAGGQRPVVKVNPLANWSSAHVWEHIRMLEIPYNPLHDRGFVSIGCQPCTRPVGPNQHEREGRWWWEAATIKECGLHGRNLPADALDAD